MQRLGGQDGHEQQPLQDQSGCIGQIESALQQAGASLRDVVRVRYILPRAEDFPATWPTLRGAFGDIRPAATMIEAGLADPRMKIEIEVDAVAGAR